VGERVRQRLGAGAAGLGEAGIVAGALLGVTDGDQDGAGVLDGGPTACPVGGEQGGPGGGGEEQESEKGESNWDSGRTHGTL
jgi:hypothetical protein